MRVWDEFHRRTRVLLEVAVIQGAKYAKSHEYAKVDGDVATIGISDFAQVRVCAVMH